jgi:hypothetical protein
VHPLAVPADVEVGVCTAVAGVAEHRGVCCPVRPEALGSVLGGHQARAMRLAWKFAQGRFAGFCCEGGGGGGGCWPCCLA